MGQRKVLVVKLVANGRETPQMPNLTASIPHQLTRAEAKRRIQEQVGTLRRQHGTMFTDLKESWTGDRMNFSAAAMGQTISGHLTVNDQAVNVDIALPWILSMLAGAVKQRIAQQVKHVLAIPAPMTPGATNNS
jgi:putative polyhydroxyalkanoate system protein